LLILRASKYSSGAIWQQKFAKTSAMKQDSQATLATWHPLKCGLKLACLAADYQLFKPFARN
jgi:hypothetical protein